MLNLSGAQVSFLLDLYSSYYNILNYFSHSQKDGVGFGAQKERQNITIKSKWKTSYKIQKVTNHVIVFQKLRMPNC